MPRPRLLLPYLVTVAVVLVPVAVSILLAQHQGRETHKQAAAQIAADLLHRSEAISGQVSSAVLSLEQIGDADPCSDASIQRMRQLTLSRAQLVDVGYVADDRLRCSAYGRHDGGGTPIGPADFTTARGYTIRTRVTLPYAPGTAFRITAGTRSGYAAILHPELATEIVREEPGQALGIVVISNRAPLFQRGALEPRWLDELGDQEEVQFVDGARVVALKRSRRFDYAVYVATAPGIGQAQWVGAATVLVPLGVAVGLLLGYVVVRISRQQLSMVAVLRQGLRRGELFVVYQPMVDLATGRWIGAEALLRWQRPNGEMIPPDVFIPLAERSALIAELTRRLIDRVVADAATIRELRRDFHLGLNYSAEDLQSPESVHYLDHAVRHSGVDPATLVVEATERVFMNTEAARRHIDHLRACGLGVAVDDFGTGYSSLAFLTSMALDYLKIDKSFVDTIGSGAATSQVVGHIIEMGKSLGLKMIAEGVETPAQAEYLRERGVQYAQGWLFAKAMSLDELVQRLRAGA